MLARRAESPSTLSRSAVGSSSRRRWAALTALAILDLALGAVAAGEISATGGTETAELSPAIQEPTPAPANDFALPPLAEYHGVLDRPLFARNRRPPPPQAAVPTAGDVKSLVLAGITISGEQKTAFVRHGAAAPPVSVAEGQQIDGWTVRVITDDRIVLRYAATDYTLRLYAEGTAPAKH